MLNRLFLDKWNIEGLEDLDYAGYLKKKRETLFSQLCLLGALAAVTQGAYDLYDGFPKVMSIDLGFAFILFLGHYLNRKGKYYVAALLIFLSSNLILFSFAAIVPKGVGIYLLYFPLIAFSFISYDYHRRYLSFGFTILSIALNGILLLTDFQPFGTINLQPTDPAIPFGINLLVSILLLSLGINFLIKINFSWEQVLLDQQKETKRLSEELVKKNTSLEKTNRELDSFVYSTSHDLRAPLSSILGLINLTELESEKPSETMKNYLEMIKERVNGLDDFIQDVIDYSRNSRTDLVVDDVDLEKLFDKVLLTNRFLVNTGKVEISTKIDVRNKVKLDKSRFFRVLNNLVSNAIKYSDLSKEKSFVHIYASKEANKLIIKIEDNGIGIEEKNVEKVFDMFFRATEKADGSGLGLYIAKEMISKMNGSLELESKINIGSTFIIKLPV
ncbi:MAG: GHKL domain-containing protein [Cyclobacteriaceae bacterium]|nr:GHKL domain-containing protein [Cyclobacteriaceae bacterium]